MQHGLHLDPDVSDFIEGVKMARENGNTGLVVADTIEELAELAGVDVDNHIAVVVNVAGIRACRVKSRNRLKILVACFTVFIDADAAYGSVSARAGIVDSSIVRYYMKNGVDNVSLVRPDPDVSDFIEGVKMAQENGNTGLVDGKPRWTGRLYSAYGPRS